MKGRDFVAAFGLPFVYWRCGAGRVFALSWSGVLGRDVVAGFGVWLPFFLLALWRGARLRAELER